MHGLRDQQADLLHLQSDTIAAELLNVGVNFLRKKLPSESSLETTCKEVFRFKDPFLNVYSLYAVALTTGLSTATSKNSFSSVTRILQPRRRSMTHE